MSEDKLKETREFLIGLFKLGALLSVSFKDGVQATDAAVVIEKIAADETLKQALLEAYNGANSIPAELHNASIWDDLSLAPDVFRGVKSIMEAMKS